MGAWGERIDQLGFQARDADERSEEVAWAGNG
jgi:hypothetical protein